MAYFYLFMALASLTMSPKYKWHMRLVASAGWITAAVLAAQLNG